MGGIIYRPAETEDWKEAMQLAWRTFNKFEAPEYTKEGIDNFRDFVFDEKLKEMFENGYYKVYVALDNDKIVGMISLRDVNHISLLFVDENYHRRGIGSKLVQVLQDDLFRETGQMMLTVNAAPYAEAFYHRVGFINRGLRTITDGITYTPMELLF